MKRVFLSLLAILSLGAIYTFVLRDTPVRALSRLSGLNIPKNAQFLPFSYVGFGIVGGTSSDVAALLSDEDFDRIVAEARAAGFKELTYENWVANHLPPNALTYPFCSCNSDYCISEATAPCGPETKVFSRGLFLNKRDPGLPFNDSLSLWVVTIDMDRKWVRAHVVSI